MVVFFDRMQRAWPDLLKATVVGAAAFLAVSKLKASPLTSAHLSALPKFAAMTSGVIVAIAMFAVQRCSVSHPLERGKGRFRAYPALRGCDDNAAGFTAASIHTRLPRIIDDIIATTPDLHVRVVDELLALRLEIMSNGVISGLPTARASLSSQSVGTTADDADQEPDWPS